MKKLSTLVLGCTACLLLASCTPTSINPLSSPKTAQPDQRLLGDWYGDTNDSHDTYHFTLKKGAWMHVVITHSKTDDKPDSYDLFPTVIGKQTFLNVQMDSKDDKRKPLKMYVLLRYALSSDQKLSSWNMSSTVLAAAINAGKLKGIVQEDAHPITGGQPAQPDRDITLQDTSEHLANFIQSTDVDLLFSEKMSTLHR